MLPTEGFANNFLALFSATLLLASNNSSVAATSSMSSIPEHAVYAAPETDLPIRVKPGKPQVVHINGAFGQIKVDDKPETVSAVPFDAGSIVLYPHKPKGGAHITVFGKDGKPLMARYVVIEDPLQKYIRIHQVCRTGDKGACEKTNTYYCPNLCYETHLTNSSKALTELN